MQYVPNVPQPRRSLAVPLMAAAVLGAGLATATFALINIEDEPIVSLPTPAEESAVVPSDAVAGQRADGGPEEGTAQAITVAPAASSAAAAARYDGGPNEGTAQAITVAPAASSAAAATRYDGGPNEGTAQAITARPAAASAASATGIRYDGGPEEGSRSVVTEQPDTTISGGPPQFSGARP
jgi:hypothetical protein